MANLKLEPVETPWQCIDPTCQPHTLKPPLELPGASPSLPTIHLFKKKDMCTVHSMTRQLIETKRCQTRLFKHNPLPVSQAHLVFTR